MFDLFSYVVKESPENDKDVEASSDCPDEDTSARETLRNRLQESRNIGYKVEANAVDDDDDEVVQKKRTTNVSILEVW